MYSHQILLDQDITVFLLKGQDRRPWARKLLKSWVATKVQEWFAESSLGQQVHLEDMQFGFMPTLSQDCQPKTAQLPKKAALPVARMLAAASHRSSKTGSWGPFY